MFEKVNQAAEQVATSMSRRGFLGKLGQGALALAGALGGLLVLPRMASGQRSSGYVGCCRYSNGSILCIVRGRCQKTYNGYALVAAWGTDAPCINCYR